MPLTPHRAIAILGLASALAAGGALAEVPQDEEGFTPFEAVDTGETHSLDEVDTGHTESLDSVDTGHTETLDSVDTGGTHSLASEQHTPTTSLEAAEEDPGYWEPPPCSQVRIDLGGLPPGTDSDAWHERLRKAKQREDATRKRLELADIFYARVKTDSGNTGDEVRARKAARHEYSQARCALPALLRHARRAGVLAEVTRPYL